MRSRPGITNQSGFTVLECEVAIIVMVLLAYGLMNMMSSHEVLVTDLEDIAVDESIWYVVQPDEQLKRWMGQPATLSASWVVSSFGSTGVGQFGDVYEIDVVDGSYVLSPMTASAQVALTTL